jgi:hypothetical protein
MREAITFGDLVGKLDYLELACQKCDRAGRYSVRGLVRVHGREHGIPDWITEVTRDCPRKAGSMRYSDPCGASCPGLVGIRL